MTLKECYVILQIPQDAGLDTLKSAYRKRAFQLHPDLHPDDPAAARDFQRLNEAYVLLTHHLDKGFASAQKNADSARQEAEGQARRNFEQAKDRFDWANGHGGQRRAQQQNRRANASYRAQQDDVLRDILGDPFARRVFEDIYREIRKSGGNAAATAPPAPEAPKNRQISVEVGKRGLSFDLSKGVTGAVKGWMRRQIDSEESVDLPAAHLTPGSKVRLQILQGIGGEKRTIEFTLPKDFVVGRPVRLKGLGKRLGPWKGDLYIRLYAKI